LRISVFGVSFFNPHSAMRHVGCMAAQNPTWFWAHSTFRISIACPPQKARRALWFLRAPRLPSGPASLKFDSSYAYLVKGEGDKQWTRGRINLFPLTSKG
jgi:hypothetical protein